MKNNELYHYGIKGMKWGVRRFQNEDGSLTPKGIKRYAEKGYAQDSYRSNKTVLGKAYDKYTGAHKIAGRIQYDISSDAENKKRAEQYLKEKNEKKITLTSKQKKAIKVGVAVAGTAIAAYGAYKVGQIVKNKQAGKAAVEKALKDRAELTAWVEETKRSGLLDGVKSMTRQVGDQVWTYENNPSAGVLSREMIYDRTRW